MKSPLDENDYLSKNYQRHYHSLFYYFKAVFCNARRCWRLSSFILLCVAAVGMIYLGGFMARSKTHTVEHILQKSNQQIYSLKETENLKLNAVRNAFVHAFDGYEKYAWGYDELKPVSKVHEKNWFGLGLTAIDALDTSIIMRLPGITAKIRNLCTSLKYDHDGLSNVFELTIRVLGSFLTGYNLTNDTFYLEKAVEIGDILMLAFDKTPTPLPATSINFAFMKAVPDHVVSLSEATTIQLEFKYLTYLTKDPKYWNAAQLVMKHVFSLERPLGLAPYYLSYESGKFYNSHIRLGSRSDSYYEYLAKQYLQTNFTEPIYQKEWDIAVRGIREKLLGISTPNNLLFVGELPNGIDGSFSTNMEHLVCFLPGTLALAATKGKPLASGIKLSIEEKNDLDLAEELVQGCYETYHQTLTGLSPETVNWRQIALEKPKASDSGKVIDAEGEDLGSLEPWEVLEAHMLPSNSDTKPTVSRHKTHLKAGDMADFDVDFGFNLLRPETIESIFILYQITGKKIYREMGWEMFESFEKWCKVETGGYSSIENVHENPPRMRDKMESFFLSETLKYFYLLFSDEVIIPLDKYVINTEAHPLPIFKIDDLKLKEKLIWLENK